MGMRGCIVTRTWMTHHSQQTRQHLSRCFVYIVASQLWNALAGSGLPRRVSGEWQHSQESPATASHEWMNWLSAWEAWNVSKGLPRDGL
jgi:hypothetical protein